jgi:uncharacterized membrane protein
MNHHLLQAAQNSGLGAPQRQTLYALATRPPAATLRWLLRGLAMSAALLLGLGLIFWIAANWQLHTRGFKLGVVQTALAVAVLLAVAVPRARTAALLAATLALGGLLALVGQTYQTGADAWQLFAVWALLALPWTLLQRSELLWTLWVAIASLALGLWTGRGTWWHMPPLDVMVVNLLAWLPLVLLPAFVRWRGWLSGSQPGPHAAPGQSGQPEEGRWGQRWAVRLAVAVAVALWASQATVAGLDWSASHRGARVAVALLALGLMGLVAAGAWRWRDLPSLAMTVFGANVAVMAWLGRWVWDAGGDNAGGMSLLSVLAMLMLAGTAKALLHLQRRWRDEAAGGVGHQPSQAPTQSQEGA